MRAQQGCYPVPAIAKQLTGSLQRLQLGSTVNPYPDLCSTVVVPSRHLVARRQYPFSQQTLPCLRTGSTLDRMPPPASGNLLVRDPAVAFRSPLSVDG